MQAAREVSWKIILVYLILSMGLVTLINLVLFPGVYFDLLSNATSNLLNATFQANVLNLLLFSVIIFGWGKLRPADVGWHWRKLPQALLLTALLWAAVQLLMLLINVIYGGTHLSPVWDTHGFTTVTGALLGQLFGNALFEETLYRGFYLSQFFHKIKHPNPRRRTVFSILMMLALFILSHIPNRIFSGYSLAEMPLDFALLFVWGLFFTSVYLVSDNLFLAVGVHALFNQPTLITEAPLAPQVLILALTIAMLVFIRKRAARQQARLLPVGPSEI